MQIRSSMVDIVWPIRASWVSICFFILSGFLITTLLIREIDENGQFSLRKFAIRRALRILPPYYFVVTVVGCISIFYKDIEVGYLMPYYYFFVANFLTERIPTLSILWSLSVEEQFYVLWPLTLFFVRRSWLPPILIALLCFNAMIGIWWAYLPSIEMGPLLFIVTDVPFAPILMGALFAMIANSKDGYAILYRFLGRKWASSVASCVLIEVLAFTPSTGIEGWNNPITHLSMTMLLATLVLRPDTKVAHLFQLPFVRRIGAVSYGIYLYHLVTKSISLSVLQKMGIDNDWLLLLVYAGASYLMAEISFRTLEAYFRRFRPS